MEPRQGPVDGGTLVTLHGQQLNTGSVQSVQFADHTSNITRYCSLPAMLVLALGLGLKAKFLGLGLGRERHGFDLNYEDI